MLAMSAAHVGDVRRDRRTGNGLGRRRSNAGRTIGKGSFMDTAAARLRRARHRHPIRAAGKPRAHTDRPVERPMRPPARAP